MAANQLVQARIDGAVKEEAAAVLAAMGLTISDAVRLLLTRVAHEKALPFAPLVPNAVTIEAMKEARKGGLPRFNSVQTLLDGAAWRTIERTRKGGASSTTLRAITSGNPGAGIAQLSTPAWRPSWKPSPTISPWNLGATTMPSAASGLIIATAT